MAIEIKVPTVGESINEGVIVAWLKKDGDPVVPGDALFELETDKITMAVPSEAAGRLKIGAAAGETVKIGQVVGSLEEGGAAAAAPAPVAPAPAPAAPAPAPAAPAPSNVTPLRPAATPAAPAPAPAVAAAAPGAPTAELSPGARRLAEEFHLDPSAIAGTGKDGRVTKEDVLRFIDNGGRNPAPAFAGYAGSAPAAPPAPPALTTAREVLMGGAPATAEPAAARQTRKPMTQLRKRIAQRLVEAQSTAAILTTFNEVDLTNVMDLRAKHKDAFEKKHGVKLGMMSFFVKASVEALKAVPQLNAQIQGDEIVQNHFYDIGVAVSTDKGLMVPVIRDVDQLSFAGVEKALAAYAVKARDRKIELADLQGGSFTISNGGVFGSLLSTPILNPPQAGILGMHGIKKRPVVVDDQIVIRPMMYLAVSYDHRLVDGSEAVTFLKRIVECVENPERILLDL
jgi:2-oxoglutarate dehydrogenase E2 component (dihydrolipoamide succinyltransferase)